MRNFGMTSRATVEDNQSRGSLHGTNSTRADFRMPSGSILSPSCPPFKRGQVSQACIDGLAVVVGFFILCSLAASLPLAVVLMFFIRG